MRDGAQPLYGTLVTEAVRVMDIPVWAVNDAQMHTTIDLGGIHHEIADRNLMDEAVELTGAVSHVSLGYVRKGAPIHRFESFPVVRQSRQVRGALPTQGNYVTVLE